jgi:diguanylate cyclase (GGDEF)-like protein
MRSKRILTKIGDLNKLKNINDKYGHIMGDKYINLTAEAIKKSLRDENFAAGIGGDEFVVILPEADSDTAAAVSKRILENIEKKNKEAELPERLSIALGYETADFNDQNNTFQNVIECYHQADQKMYENKFSQR